MHLREAPFTVNAAPHEPLSFIYVERLKIYLVVSLGYNNVHLGTQCAPFHQICKVNHL